MIGEKEDTPNLESVDLVNTNKIAPANQKHSKLSAGTPAAVGLSDDKDDKKSGCC